MKTFSYALKSHNEIQYYHNISDSRCSLLKKIFQKISNTGSKTHRTEYLISKHKGVHFTVLRWELFLGKWGVVVSLADQISPEESIKEQHLP